MKYKLEVCNDTLAALMIDGRDVLNIRPVDGVTLDDTLIRLIAAAPALLEALRTLESIGLADAGPWGRTVARAARAAIALATAEEK